MKRFIIILLACAATASAQTYITVTAETNRVIRTNFSLVRSQVSDLSGASFAISNITGLQTALDGKLTTNGSAAGLSNFPASLLTTNGSAAALTNFPADLMRTNGDASTLTNFPADLMRTNGDASTLTNYPSELLRTNGDGSGLTNLPNADLTNATGILPLANGGTGATNASTARTALELGTAATNDATAFQAASTNLTALASGDGSSLTNVTITDASTLTNFPADLMRTNGDASTLTNFPADLLRTNGSAAALTNFPSELLRTNGDGGGLTNISVDLTAVLPSYSNNALKVLAVASGETNVEWIAVSNTVTDASTLTNFPANLLQTNSADGSFPAFLARTNADASGFTNFPTFNQNTTGTASNVTGVVQITNGGSGASNVTNARINLLPSYTGNEGKILAVNSNATDLVWQTDAGGSVDLTNATGVLAISNGGTGADTANGALTNLGVLLSAGVNIGGTANTTTAVLIGSAAAANGGSGLGGVAIGRSAEITNSGIAIGYDAFANGKGVGGIALGYQATNNSDGGASIGYQSSASNGAAIGRLAAAINGFAGGNTAKATATNSSQIGTGTNATDNTIQFLSAGSVDTNSWSALANSTTIGREILQAPTNGTDGQTLVWTNNDVAWATVSGGGGLPETPLAISNGGTGASNQSTARVNLLPALSSNNIGYVLTVNSNATDVAWEVVTAGGSVNLSNVTGTLPLTNGGTGATNAAAARNNLGFVGTGLLSVISGGANNTASSAYATVGGGAGNTSGNDYATVSGGYSNVASGYGSTISGGDRNTSITNYGVIGGGLWNTSSGASATVGGGYTNAASSSYATVSGGSQNTASGGSATVVGGSVNTASANFSTVGGGHDNTASGEYAFAAGRRAKATNNGAFVWADSANADFSSTAQNTFNVRASGGVYLDLGTNGISFANTTNQAVTRTNLGIGGGITATNTWVDLSTNTNTVIISNGVITSWVVTP
jgi:hypothetical protein